MKPDRNLELHNEIKKTRNGILKVKKDYIFFSILIALRSNLQSKIKSSKMMYICKNNISENMNTEDEKW